jgi:microcystin-dependent protein
MSDPYIGEIRMFGGNFAIQGWMLCNGQLLPISQFDALFALIGTTYGGDGQTTFALPDLRGRVPIHVSSNFPLGTSAGTEEVTLTVPQLAMHNHAFAASGNNGTQSSPAGNTVGACTAPLLYRAGAPNAPLASQAFPPPAGNNQPHPNMQPYQVINFIIAIEGLFPPRN